MNGASRYPCLLNVPMSGSFPKALEMANFLLNNVLQRLGLAEGGTDFIGGQNIQAPSERLREKAVRGGAPFTTRGLATAFGNALGVMDPVTAGLQTMASMATGLNLGGFHNIPGHFAVPHGPPGSTMTRRDYDRAHQQGEIAARVSRGSSFAGKGYGGPSGRGGPVSAGRSSHAGRAGF
jgi:hypothetical protein